MMAAAAKKSSGGSCIKKRRSDPNRARRQEPSPPPPPGSGRRSLRPRHRRYIADFDDEFEDLEEERESEEEEERGRRKLKLVLKLPPVSTTGCRDSSPLTAPKSRRTEARRHASPASDYSPSSSRSGSPSSSSSSEEEEEEEEIVKPLKKRRIDRVRDSDGSGHREGRKAVCAQGRKANAVRRPIRAVSGTPMPRRKALEEILDKLQKKDTYGVFAQPVDPEELPDYHDVIERPMDFGTVRRKLASGRYRSFEQFEDDVFLICSNAMQYNAPDTIYFRQACSIQDMARKNFQEVRADLKSNGVERKSEEDMKRYLFAGEENNASKKSQGGTAPRLPGFDICLLERRKPPQPSSNTVVPLRCDIASRERKILKKHYESTPETPGPDVSFMGKRRLKKPQYRTSSEPPGSDISSLEKKTLKKPLRVAAPFSDILSLEKKIPRKPQNRTAPEPQGSLVSVMKPMVVRKPRCRTVPKPPAYISSTQKDSLKQLQNRTTPEPPGSDISSMEKEPLKQPRDKTEAEPPYSDISSQERKTIEDYHSMNEPLCSDISSGATLGSGQGMSTALSKRTANGDSSSISPCSVFGMAHTSGAMLAEDTCNELTAGKANGDHGTDTHNDSAVSPCAEFGTAHTVDAISAEDTCNDLTTGKAAGDDQTDANNGSADGSSLVEGKSEQADEVLGSARCSPPKLGHRPFRVDVNRRVTYNTCDEQPVSKTNLVFDVFEDETRQLVAVGLDSRYSYARSLACFAASLGPVAWEVASKKIEQALPPGVKFGRGWVGDYEPLSTPVLYFGKNAQQQPAGRREDKGIAIKSETISTVAVQEKGNEVISEATRNGQHKGMPFSLNNQATGQPPNRAANPSNDRRNRKREQKQGLFGVNLELQPCTSRTTQQQRNHLAGNLSTAYPTERGGHVLDISSEVAKTTSLGLVSSRWKQVHSEDQKLQQQKSHGAQPQTNSSEAHVNGTARPRLDVFPGGAKSNSPATFSKENQVHEGQKLQQARKQMAHAQTEIQKPQQQKGQMAGDFAMAYPNGTTMQPPGLYPEAQTSNFSITNYVGRNQAQTESLKQLEAVTAQRRNDGLSMNVGGLSGWRSCESRQNAPFGIVSNNQSGVHWLAQGSQEQAMNDPLRWMNSSGKLSVQPNRGSNNLERPMPTVQIPRREDPGAAAAQAWMSFGAPAEWKSVNVGGLPHKQAGSAPLGSAWNFPSPVSKVHEETNVKREPLHATTENSQAQTKGLVIFPQLMTTDLSRLRSPWPGLVQHNKQKDSLPPDLNISFQPPGSPASSGILVDSQQPDLALQL